MALANWTIDLRVDFEDASRNALMLEAVRAAAKELLTTARLLADGRQPDIAIENSDLYIGRDEVDMFTKDEKEEYGL
jgi:hypothetical protein